MKGIELPVFRGGNSIFFDEDFQPRQPLRFGDRIDPAKLQYPASMLDTREFDFEIVSPCSLDYRRRTTCFKNSRIVQNRFDAHCAIESLGSRDPRYSNEGRFGAFYRSATPEFPM